MTKNEAKNAIVTTIESLQGCKSTQLAAESNLINVFSNFDLVSLIDEMIKEELLVEIEYVLPNMDWRCKSFLLPAKSQVRTINALHMREQNG
jgi:hypothetical protein